MEDGASELDLWSARAEAVPSVALPLGATLEPPATSQNDAATPAEAFGRVLPTLMLAALRADAAERDMVRLAKAARHFGYRHAARDLLAAATAPSRRPFDIATYREYWLEVSVTGGTGDEATMRGSHCMHLIGEIRARLSALDVGYYAIYFNESGLGDQMMTASVTAKLGEILGLHFIGVVDEHVGKRGRIGALFGGDESWFQMIFGDAMPVIPRDQCREFAVLADWRIGFRDGDLQIVLTRLLRVLEAAEESFNVLTLRMDMLTAAWLQPLLWDQRGGLLENGFTAIAREAARPRLSRIAPPRMAHRTAHRARVALHLRIGDVVNIPLVVPGHFLIPHAGAGEMTFVEMVADEKMATHQRANRVPHFIALAQACRQRFGDDIALDIVTDGYARILANLNADWFVRHLAEAAKRPIDVDALRAHFLERDAELTTAMSALGTLHCGEGDDQFLASIGAIRQADIIVTTSGQFAPTIANFFNEYGHDQTFFTFDRDIRLMLNRRGVAVSYLGTDMAANTAAILDAIGAVSRARRETAPPVEPPVALERTGVQKALDDLIRLLVEQGHAPSDRRIDPG